jgi:hypothetical protein
MPRGERFEFDRLTEAELEQLRRFLEINRGQWRRPIILSPDELLTAKQGRRWTEKNRKRLSQRDRD